MENQRKKAYEVFEKWNPSATQKLETYLSLFPEQFEKFKHSERAQIKGLNENDLLALGRTFEQQTMLKPMNEDMSFSQLGASPTLAYDFITALFGKSVIPYIASEQVIDELQGLVYFENIIAVTPRGVDVVKGEPVVEGDILAKAAGVPQKYPQGFAGEMVYGEELAGVEPDGTETHFGEADNPDTEVKLAYGPIRPYYTKVIVTTGTAEAPKTVIGVDDGKGNIIGAGINGKIVYSTGAIELFLLEAPIADSKVLVNYATNFELGQLPSITTQLDSKFVRANVYGLQTDTSILASYTMGKRFQFNLQERAVQILQEQILNEITNELIMKIETAVVENQLDETLFDMTIPQGVSQQAHFNAADYTFGVVRQKMATRSGKGQLTVALAGAGACAFLEQNNKFKMIGQATQWATVYGVYNNSTIVIRCPQLADTDAIYFIYKGEESPFDAAAVYAPYMPLVGIEDLPVPTSMLNRRSAVASMAAVDILVPGYIQKFKLVRTDNVNNNTTPEPEEP